VIQAVLNACGNDGADLVTVQFPASPTLYFSPSAHNTVTDLKHAIRQNGAHAGRGLRIIQAGAFVGDADALNGTPYHCIYALGAPPDATLIVAAAPPDVADEEDGSDSDDDVEIILNVGEQAVAAPHQHQHVDDEEYPYSNHH
jgi:hypothetical protein